MRQIDFCVVLAIIIFLTALNVVNCKGNSQEDSYDRAIEYNSKTINEKITKELESRNIPFKTNGNGPIHYQSKHQAIVDLIAQKYEKESSVKSPNISFTDEKYKEKFIKLLKEKNIPYKLSKLYNSEKDYIIWNEVYDNEVQQLVRKIYVEMGITKKPHRVNFENKEEKDHLLTLLNRDGVPYRLVNDELTNPAMGPDIEYDWVNYDKVKKLVIETQNSVKDK
jgi:hypothetical protein